MHKQQPEPAKADVHELQLGPRKKPNASLRYSALQGAKLMYHWQDSS